VKCVTLTHKLDVIIIAPLGFHLSETLQFFFKIFLLGFMDEFLVIIIKDVLIFEFMKKPNQY
jgi:hypothetical protein